MDHSLHETQSVNIANKRLVKYADSEDSEEEMSQPPRKRQRVNFSDDKEDYEDYYTIKPVRQTESRVFRSKANIYEVDVKKFPDEDVATTASIVMWAIQTEEIIHVQMDVKPVKVTFRV